MPRSFWEIMRRQTYAERQTERYKALHRQRHAQGERRSMAQDELGEDVPTPEALDAMSPEEYARESKSKTDLSQPVTRQCPYCDRRTYPREGPSWSKDKRRGKAFGPPYNRAIPGVTSGACVDCERHHREYMRRYGVRRGDRLFYERARGMSHMLKRTPYGDPRERRGVHDQPMRPAEGGG